MYVFLLVSFHALNNLFEDYLVWQADIQSIFVISKTLEFRYYEYVINWQAIVLAILDFTVKRI